ncbi:putative chromatin regulator PHD family [Rosa chinensis]|uniref:Non-structural maintenance of chromosomes element 1 homolog n=1 Tax=Rosa chinensis TaxID=74649 RepID=A0A2P6PM78_ROSCH|nr:putative chromatin regulator PHD family [Rosa chinensis]
MIRESGVNSGTSSQSQGDSLPIPTALKNFSMSQKEKTLDEFVRDKWLSFTAEGHVGLGVRSFLDLRNWFRNNDVPSCEVCNETGVKAVLCQKEGCSVRIHQYCLGKPFAKKKGESLSKLWYSMAINRTKSRTCRR